MNTSRMISSSIESEAKCVYFSRFLPTIDAGGGARRLVQLLSELEVFGCALISSAREDRLDHKKLAEIHSTPINVFKKWRLMHGDYSSWNSHRRDTMYRLRSVASFWAHDLHEFRHLKIAIVDDPIYFLPLVKKLKKHRLPIIAACHNIETLASPQVISSKQKTMFRKEIGILSSCDLVITISREETILLTNLDIKTFYLPYYPVAEIQSRLIRIRKRRRTTEKKHILMIGSAMNIMTRRGMRAIIEYWKSHQVARYGEKLLVAGYKTDMFFQDVGSDDTIEFLGPLSNEEHDKLLSSVKACLCYQESGSGALTRICEMLIANVPVVANSHAARSYFNMDGVIEFATPDDFENALQKLDEANRFIPLPEKPDASGLRHYLQQLMS